MLSLNMDDIHHGDTRLYICCVTAGKNTPKIRPNADDHTIKG